MNSCGILDVCPQTDRSRRAIRSERPHHPLALHHLPKRDRLGARLAV